jgi:hypothetical protein
VASRVSVSLPLLNAREHSEVGIDAVDCSQGGMQLDALVTLDDGQRSRPFLLSIVVGESGLLHTWISEDIERIGAETQIVLTYKRRGAGNRCCPIFRVSS